MLRKQGSSTIDAKLVIPCTAAALLAFMRLDAIFIHMQIPELAVLVISTPWRTHHNYMT